MTRPSATPTPVDPAYGPSDAPTHPTAVSQIRLEDQAFQQMHDRDWKGAVETYTMLTQANAYSASHWFNYGYALHKTQCYRKAVPAFQKAIELGFGFDNKLWSRYIYTEDWWKSFGPKINAPWYMIARAQAQLRRPSAALKSLERALQGGFADEEALKAEPDLTLLRDDPEWRPRFRALVGLYPPEGLSREEKWHYDLDFLARRIPQIHYAPFRNIPQKQFQGAIERLKEEIGPKAKESAGLLHQFIGAIHHLKKEIPALKDYEVYVKLSCLIARIGDGHTAIGWPDELGGKPFLYLYSDGLYVRTIPKTRAEALGGRVLTIAGRKAEEVLKAVEVVVSADNAMDYRAEAPSNAINPYVLAALKLIPEEEMDRIPLVVQQPTGEQVTVTLSRQMEGAWVSINAYADNPPPLSLNIHDSIWFDVWPDRSDLLYCQCNTIGHSSEQETWQAFHRRMFAFIEANQVNYLAIDLRNNRGGDSGLNPALLHEIIRCGRINRRGRLFVLIGRKTFSAAQNLTTALERETEAVFVGEPSGSRPNFVGQSTLFTLPCCGMTVSCSSLYHQEAGISCDYRLWVEPDIVAETSSNNAANNRDPGMEAILQEISVAG